MTAEQQQQALGKLAVWVATAQELTTKAQESAYRTDMLPHTQDYGGFIARAAYYLGLAALEKTDFQAALAPTGKTYGPFFPKPDNSGWYSLDLTAGKAYINKLTTLSGLTQIRLRFMLDDNNNTVTNYLSFYSGNAVVANRPQLIIEYTTTP